MTRHRIIDKLAQELQEPITSERQVVYLLVELRKLIEINQDGASYKTLKFCCDWVAHPLLQGPEAQHIVRQFDKCQALTEAMYQEDDGQQLTEDMSFIEPLDEIQRLSRFRSELGAYLTLQGFIGTDLRNPDLALTI